MSSLTILCLAAGVGTVWNRPLAIRSDGLDVFLRTTIIAAGFFAIYVVAHLAIDLATAASCLSAENAANVLVPTIVAGGAFPVGTAKSRRRAFRTAYIDHGSVTFLGTAFVVACAIGRGAS